MGSLPEEILAEAESARAFLLKLGRTLRGLADPTAVQIEACRLLGEHLGVDRAYFAETKGELREVHVRQNYLRGESPSLEGKHRASDLGWALETMQQGEPVIVADTLPAANASRTHGGAMADNRIVAHLEVPILKDGAVVAALCVTESEPRHWTDMEIELVQETAERVWSTTTRVRAEQALRDSETRLQTVIEDVPLAIALTGRAGEILLRNPRFDQLWGRPAHVTTARTYSDAYEGYHLDGRPIASEDWPGARAVLKGEVVENEVYEIVQATGQRIKCWFGAAPVRDASGSISGGVVVFRDVTDDLRRQAALRQSEMRLKEASRAKDEFLAMLAHELRNPLAPITSASDLLSRTAANDPQGRAAVDIINRQLTQMTRLLDDLLDVSRITQGRIQLQRTSVDIARVVAQAIEMVEPQLRKRSHELSVTTATHELYVLGDFERLVQCVGNILVNAAKYTAPGGSINIRTRGDETSAYIELSDNGIGIAPELLPHVFDLFVQSERALDRAQGGLGIGLAVVKRLVEMQEGTVHARSEGVGRGSVFEIRLPRIARAQVPASESEAAAGLPRRILIVDDNSDAADSLSMLLRLRGHQTCVAYSAKAALAAVRDFDPQVGLLDIGLPDMDGYELARELRRRVHEGGLRLVALTGYGQPEDHQRVISAGFDAHLVKPVVLTALERVLDGSPPDPLLSLERWQ